jgi:hypothetical protein
MGLAYSALAGGPRTRAYKEITGANRESRAILEWSSQAAAEEGQDDARVAAYWWRRAHEELRCRPIQLTALQYCIWKQVFKLVFPAISAKYRAGKTGSATLVTGDLGGKTGKYEVRQA